MGTRADFYVGRGKSAECIGSVAWDGYPDGFDRDGLFNATTEQQFREAVVAEIASRKDGTTPADGWPWPWDDSTTTDYAYAFDGGKVYGTYSGHWFDAATAADGGDTEIAADETPVEWPNMADKKAVTFGARSGIIIVGA
jgi:hypothetical protein